MFKTSPQTEQTSWVSRDYTRNTMLLHENMYQISNATQLNGDLQVQFLPSLESAGDIPHSGEYLVQGTKKIWIGVSRADGSKCERCWNYSLQVGSFSDHPTLCTRCYNVVGSQPIPALAAVG